MDMTTGNVQKQNRAEELNSHKKMLEDRLFSAKSEVKKAKDNPDKRVKSVWENKVSALEEEIKKVDEQLAATK